MKKAFLVSVVALFLYFGMGAADDAEAQGVNLNCGWDAGMMLTTWIPQGVSYTTIWGFERPWGFRSLNSVDFCGTSYGCYPYYMLIPSRYGVNWQGAYLPTGYIYNVTCFSPSGGGGSW